MRVNFPSPRPLSRCRERGFYAGLAVFQNETQYCFQVYLHFLVAHLQNLETKFFQFLSALGISFGLTEVHPAFHFHHQSDFMTVEIGDVVPKRALAAEFVSTQPPTP